MYKSNWYSNSVSATIDHCNSNLLLSSTRLLLPNMHSSKIISATMLAFSPLVASTCVHIDGEGHQGLTTDTNWQVHVDDALICETGVEGNEGKVPCGDGPSEGGTLEWDWSKIIGPFDATFCDENANW
jgi:hypothetical protein